MSLSSMPALQQRHNLIMIPESRLYASLTGSAAACVEIGHQIKHSHDIKKSTACIQFGLDYLGDEFYGMRSGFREIKHTWAHPTGQRLWTANATKTVKHAQQVAQDVAKALRDVVRQCDAWDVVAPDHFHYQLQAFEIFLQKQELTLNLLGMVMDVLSPCEPPTFPLYGLRKSLVELEQEKFQYGCKQVECAIRMRREMHAKLLRIASLDPEHKDIGIEEVSERVPDTEKWSSLDQTIGNTTPTEDWSYVFHCNGAGSGPMDYSFLPIPGSHPTKLVKRQQRKDTEVRALEELLDKFGDESRLDSDQPEEVMSSRKRDLATLAFHWTNAEVFAGFHRKDLTSI